MAENGNGKKYPTWFTVLLLSVLMALSAWAWSDTRSCIKENQTKLEQKVDKAQYDRDVSQIMKSLDTIQGDIKDLLRRK